MWETVLQPFVESIANALPHTRMGDRMPGKNRGKKRKTQYCLPYTRRGNQLWQPVCPFLRFLPYTYGEAPTLMTRPSPAMSSSLRVTGEYLRRPATPEPEAGLPYMYGGSPRRRRGQHADGTVFPTCTGEFHQPSRSPCSWRNLSEGRKPLRMHRVRTNAACRYGRLSCRKVFPGPFFALFLARDSDAQ